MKNKNLKVRVPMYFLGLFVMTIGIAVSVKSNLGVSPVSSIPYTLTCVWGIEMGKATILFHCALVLIQVVLLRKKFKWKSLLQILVGVVFGYFTTFGNYLMSFLPTPDNLVIRILMMLLSAVLIALGIFFYLPADLIPLAGEGTMQAVADVTHIEFSKVKIAFDCTMVAVSAAVCLIKIHSFGSVGVGTVIAAVLVGIVLGGITKLFGSWRDRLFGIGAEPSAETKELEPTTSAAEPAGAEPVSVITISREYGSGGREIARLLADQLGFQYYDAELVQMIASKSGLSQDYVRKNEQSVKNPVLSDFFHWYTYPVTADQLPNVEKLYAAEEKVIREIAAKGSCVIVGRLANFILKDRKDAFHVFISADEDSEVSTVTKRDGLTKDEALAQVHKVNRERAHHCKYFTKTEWGKARNYDLCVRSEERPYERTAELIAGALS